jgi:hypothetical protein
MRKQKQHAKWGDAAEVTPPLGPLSYCAYAVEYLDAARTARTNGPRFKPAQTYLACHAIELALVAYISSQAVTGGQSPPSLRTRNLWSLLEEAESHGLAELARLTLAQSRQIKKATRYYSQAVFEYPALTEAIRGHPDAPDIRILLTTAAVLVAAARKAGRVRTSRTRRRAARP